MTLPDLTTDAELAAYLGKSRQYVQDQCRASRWEHVRVGRSYRFTEEQVRKILDASAVKAEAKPESAKWGRRTRRSA